MSGFGESALPPISEAALPREVREGSSDDRKTYRAALGFERVLVGQLAEQMAKAAKAGGEDEESAPAGQNIYEEMLSDAVADAVIAGGGIGLAPELYRTLRQNAREEEAR